MLFEISCTFIPCLSNTLNWNNSNFDNTATKEVQSFLNLSDKILSDSELSLLSKGLSFVDTPPPPDLGILSKDLTKFHLSIKRKLAISKLSPFQNTQKSDLTPFEHPKLKNPSRWNPSGPVIVEHMALLNEGEILGHRSSNRNKHRNLSKAEFTAKRDLANVKTIVIKKADKGSAVVIQNCSDYIKEGLGQLSDTNFYRETKTDLTTVHNTLVNPLRARNALRQHFRVILYTLESAS